MSTLAVFIALGGTATAASVLISRPSQLKNGVVTSKKIKKRTIGVDRLSKKAVASLSKPGATGATGAPGAPGLVRAYGRILASGAVDATRANAGIAGVRVSSGYFCLKLDAAIDASKATPVATLDLSDGAMTFVSPFFTPWIQAFTNSSSCNQGNEIGVVTGGQQYTGGGTMQYQVVGAQPFNVLVP